MKTQFLPQLIVDLSHYLYYQVVYTLTKLLPPPLSDTPESLYARNRAAIAKVAALMPVNANEADLAAQCVAARAQAEDTLRLLRQHAGDITLVTRLNAQYGSMVRTSLAVHGRLMRVQALRHKREPTEGAADQDARAQHLIERCMVAVEDGDAELREAASLERAPPESPEPTQPASPERARAQEPETTPAKAPLACTDQTIERHAPENETNYQGVAFETWLSEQLCNHGSTGPDETVLRRLRQAIAKPRRQSPASGRESPSSTNDGSHREAATASA